MTAEVSKVTPDVVALANIREHARTRRQERVKMVLRPGLGGSKRKAPCAPALTDAMKNALSAIESNLQNCSHDQRQNRPPRRQGMTLREGLDRDIPQCKVTGLDREKDKITSTARATDLDCIPELRESRLTRLTMIEGVPERWMEIVQRRSNAEFRFTPIEGVLERLIIPTPSVDVNTPLKKLSIISNIEGVPERQWRLSSIQEQDKTAEKRQI